MRSDVCGKLRTVIQQTARDQAKHDFGITVTKEEMDAARAAIQKPDAVAESNRIRTQAQALASALAAVDRGEDPHGAWMQYLQPIGYDEAIWNANVSETRTPERRAKFNEMMAKQMATTPESLSKAIAEHSVEGLVIARKLDEAVDREIAAKDPQFDAYLKDIAAKQANADPHKRWAPGAEVNYVNDKRAQWWRARVARISVVLNDPQLYTACSLTKMGVQPAAK